MPAEPQDAITIWEAVKFLGPLVGTGGITAMAVAYIGTRRTKPDDSKPDKGPALGIQALLADHMAMERFTNEIGDLKDEVKDLVKAINRACDMMDISAALKRLQKNDD